MTCLPPDREGRVFHPWRPRPDKVCRARNPYLLALPIEQEPDEPPCWRLDIHDEAGALICWSGPLDGETLRSTVAMFINAGWRERAAKTAMVES